MSKPQIDIRPLTTNTGAEIFGVDLSKPLTAAMQTQIQEALLDYGVVFFRDQSLSDSEYLAFGKTFGAPRANPLTPHVEGMPEISRLIKEEHHETSTGDMWHADHTFLPSPMNTVLRAVEVPAFGGDTMWLNTRAAYDALPEQIKSDIAGLKALHSHSFLIKDAAKAKKHKEEHGVKPAKADNKPQENQTYYHPVVRTHPISGKKALFVNPGYTVKFHGWSRKQSEGLLNMLYEHCLIPEFQCRFRWQKDSIAMWDNSQTWHFAVNDYAGHRREMHRIVIK